MKKKSQTSELVSQDSVNTAAEEGWRETKMEKP